MARLTPKTRPASGAILCSARQIEALSVPTSQPMKPWVTWQRAAHGVGPASLGLAGLGPFPGRM